MKTFIKMLVVGVIFVPYKLSSFGSGGSFAQDLVVAAVAYGIAYASIAAFDVRSAEDV